MDEQTPTTGQTSYQPGSQATAVPLTPPGTVENLPPEPEPRIKDPASTISVNTATSFGGTTPFNPGAGKTMKQVIDLAREKQVRAIQEESKQFVNLGSPLNVKTKWGELQAGPGDVILEIGNTRAVVSKEAYDDLQTGQLELKSYDDLLRATLKRGVIARRLDDGNRLPMTPEQEAEADANIEKEVADARQAREEEKARRQRLVNIFRPKVEGQEGEPATVGQVWSAVDSSEGPPTATPSDSATLIPQFIPIEAIEGGGEEPETPPEEGTDATGATAGAPGSFTPSGATPPADLAGLNACTASPTTAWTMDQYVVLGDASEAHWNGSAWAAGKAPFSVV
jgi:hypothetical protein